jgi:hypothetical protein
MDSPQELVGVDKEQETEASGLPSSPCELLLSGVDALVAELDVQVAELVAGWWLQQPGWARPLRHL